MAATSVSQSLSFCMERKYLNGIGDTNLNPLFSLREIETTTKNSVSWIEVVQVGKPLSDSAEDCFTAMQKILYSCFMPKETQLLFLIIGNKKQNKMYLGVRAMGASIKKNIVKYLNEFIKGVWPGLQTKIIKDDSTDGNLKDLTEKVNNETLEYVYALTGIPSMESQYKSIYPATIDKLMAGMSQRNYAYLVVADPIETNEVDSMLFQCREMNGQAESLKSFNVTEGETYGTSNSHSVTDGYNSSTSESVTKRDYSKLGKLAVQGTGLAFAASFFPAAKSVMEGAVDVGGELIAGAASLLGIGAVNSIVASLTPTKSTSTTSGTNHSESNTYSTNESKSQSLSRNIVNKHIESVSEHLFYHSKRFETGKAIGMWKVGTYLLAEKESDIKGGAMQLRSILSGQESIFEPIRITDITNVIESSKSLAQFVSPVIRIDSVLNGKPFNHPLGDSYKELKTVLTTKELSYLINFPLRSVPGISVIDSTPDFSLNIEVVNESCFALGRLLYGGSKTDLCYSIPIDSLVKHTLLSGINGSGKTNTVQAILNGINGKLPFLVIEPAKTEYVDWAIQYNNEHPDTPIDIYIPGCKKYKTGFVPKQLKLNPFELVWLDKEQEPNVLSHIDRLKSTFAAAFPMYDILPVLMEDLIYTVYQNKSTDWLTQEPVLGSTLPPTLNSMSVSVDKVIANRQYEERIERNMKACFHTRIDSLKRGWKGEMLNTVHSTPWNELFQKPCIINLSYVGDDVDKSFFMALILQFLYEYCTALAETQRIDFNDNSCRHLTIIEEAHRVMAKCDNQELPQYKSAMMFSNMLSEIRAYGEGMLLVDQVPTRLIPDAIKNTNLKITHRLVAEDDCKAIGEAMGLNDDQRKVISKLLTGQCIVSSSLNTEAYWVKVDKVK
ncbi:ATP-binding protein [Bacteroides caecigallinarum]|nr:ATP-binding protein [Bacteroides caecigallinarum]